MPDLTTTYLKCLLEQTTPGPWEYEGSQFQEITALDDAELEQPVISLDRYTEKDLCNRPADMHLAAHAPELAEELILLREHIEGLITVMENKAATGSSPQDPAIIAGYLKEIVLGDHDD